MAIACLYDIHGNLPALDAVLSEIRHLDVDEIIAGGDVIVGPMSGECLDVLLNLDIPVSFIQGNCEVAVLNQMKGKSPGNLPEVVLEDIRWTAGELTSLHKQEMEKWPMTLEYQIPGIGNVLFCHGTPRDENEIFTKITPKDALATIFKDVDADLIICGHTHMQFDLNIGSTRIINSGSVGMSFGKTGADWLLLGSETELKHTSYDLEEAARRIQSTGYPQANDFAEKNVLNPPSEEEMLGIFAPQSFHGKQAKQ